MQIEKENPGIFICRIIRGPREWLFFERADDILCVHESLEFKNGATFREKKEFILSPDALWQDNGYYLLHMSNYANFKDFEPWLNRYPAFKNAPVGSGDSRMKLFIKKRQNWIARMIFSPSFSEDKNFPCMAKAAGVRL